MPCCTGISYFVMLEGAPKLWESTQLAVFLFAFALNWPSGVGLLASLPLGCMLLLPVEEIINIYLSDLTSWDSQLEDSNSLGRTLE